MQRRRRTSSCSCPSPPIRCTSAARCSPAPSRSSLPLREAHGWLPDLDAVDDETWERCAILWVNYPHNPTGAVAPLSFLEEAAELARAHGFYLASDEAYTELWFDEPPTSAVQLADRRQRRRLPDALEALVDDGLPLGLRVRRGRS